MKALIVLLLLLVQPAWAGRTVMKEQVVDIPDLGAVDYTTETEVARFVVPPGENIILIRVQGTTIVGDTTTRVRMVPQWDGASALTAPTFLLTANSTSTTAFVEVVEGDQMVTVVWSQAVQSSSASLLPPYFAVTVEETRTVGSMAVFVYITQ
jgi:hypothetical protein